MINSNIFVDRITGVIDYKSCIRYRTTLEIDILAKEMKFLCELSNDNEFEMWLSRRNSELRDIYKTFKGVIDDDNNKLQK